MSEFPTQQTLIPVNIQTNYLHETGNHFEEARQQIEKSAFYLQSIFHLLKHVAPRIEECQDLQIHEIGGDLVNLCDIGSGLAESIFLSLRVFYTAEQTVLDGSTNSNAEVNL